MTAAYVLFALSAFALGVVVLRGGDNARQRASLVSLELRFPRDVEAAEVEAFLAAISGLLPPRRIGWFHRPFLVVEVHADGRGIRHRLLVPRGLLRSVEAALAAHLPAVQHVRRDGIRQMSLNVASEYRLTNADRLLNVDGARTSSALLAALQPLRGNEVVVVQSLLAPARQVSPARLMTAAERKNHAGPRDGVMVTSEAAAALKQKRSRPLLLACLRVGVKADTTPRRRTLLRGVERPWLATRAPGTRLKRRSLRPATVARRIETIRAPWDRWPVLLNSEEALLVGFPIDMTRMLGIDFAGCPPLPVAAVVPRVGTVLGDGTHPRSRRPVALDPTGRTHHTLCVGATGSGKSTLACHLAEHDTLQGNALVVLDPKDGSLLDAIAERIPEDRLADVIVLDPTDSRPVGFDPLASTAANRELVVDRLLGLMVEIWGDNLGPRSADCLRHVFLTIAASSNVTLSEAALLLVDESFRRRVLSANDVGQEVRAWWSWVDGLSRAEWSAMTAAPLNKLRALNRSAIANTVGQTDPAIDFGRVLRDRQILLVRLPAGLLGDETTALLGAMVINQLWSAIAARAALPRAARRPASVIIDEVGSVLRFPASSIDTMLTQARGYQVAITLLAQSVSQLPTGVRSAAFANARTKIGMACSRDDAGTFARELGNGLTPEHLMGIDAFHAVAAVHAGGRTQSPATIRMRPEAEPLRHPSVVTEQSRKRWGVDRQDIEAARQARMEPPLTNVQGSVGRKPRARS